MISVPQASGGSIRRRDARRIYGKSGETGRYDDFFPVRIASKGSFAETPLTWSRELMSAKSRTTSKSSGAIRNAKLDLWRRSRNEDDIAFPMIGYYGTGRWRLEQKLALQRKIDPAKRIPRYFGYRDCLAPSSSARRILEWIKRLAILEVQRGGKLDTLNGIFRAIANCVENAVEARFDFDEDDIVLEFGNSEPLPLRRLGDGQRSMAATVADIAIRCSQLNPHLNGEASISTPGIVLIDEIDLHLHPRWQRGAVDQLRYAFPLMQFIATSRSPFIIQSMSRGGVINLDSEDTNPSMPEQMGVEDVAETVMGVEQPQRSKRFLEMLDAAEKYYKALDEAIAEEETEEIDGLRRKSDKIEEAFAENPANVAFLRLQIGGRV